jgi:hypothetical protein
MKMLSYCTASLINFVIALGSTRLLWLIPDDYLARCVITAIPTTTPQMPTKSLGLSAKVFLSAVILYTFTLATAPGLGPEDLLCGFWSFVFKTIWQAMR